MAGLAAIALRSLAPGDTAWVAKEQWRHYRDVEGFDDRFKTVLGNALEDFEASTGDELARAFIAVRGNERLGCVFCSAEGPNVARLRMFYVVPTVRGSRLGYRLLAALVEHARQNARDVVRLWTYAQHEAACRLYAHSGFELRESRTAFDYGRHLTLQRWEKALTATDLPSD